MRRERRREEEEEEEEERRRKREEGEGCPTNTSSLAPTGMHAPMRTHTLPYTHNSIQREKETASSEHADYVTGCPKLYSHLTLEGIDMHSWETPGHCQGKVPMSVPRDWQDGTSLMTT